MKFISYVLNLPWTLIGLLLALISIPKRVRLVNDVIVFNGRNFWWTNLIWYMKGNHIRGITNGNIISLGPFEEEHDLQHELVHVQQYMRQPFIYPFLYTIEVFKHGKSPNNKYEEEAYRLSGSMYRAG